MNYSSFQLFYKLRRVKISLCITVMLLLLSACHTTNVSLTPRPTNWAQKVELKGFNNLYKIDNEVYRSEQPNSIEMKELSDSGIKSILNLRHTHNDNNEAKKTGLELHHITINTWFISYDEIVESMVALKKSKKPVLIHCLHGSDRTGCIIAVYRIITCGWSKEEAIRELKEGGYGYHKNLFPNILRLIYSIDTEKLKNDIEKGLLN